MRFFKDNNGQIHAIQTEAGIGLLPDGCEEITQEEAAAITNPATPIADLQAEARDLRFAELVRVDYMINDLTDRGEDTTALRGYRIALRDMTTDPAWITDPLSVVHMVISGAPA